MYLPDAFADPRPQTVERLLREHPLGLLVVHVNGQMEGNHLPWVFDPSVGPHGVLRGHVARAHGFWSACPQQMPALVVFQGVQGYISPNGMPSKQATHRQVPTWNYEAVHMQGTLHLRDDPRFVRGVLAQLTRTHEATQNSPWKMGDAPPDYLDEMIARVIGVEVTVASVQVKAKLSQNKSAEDRAGLVQALQAQGRLDLAQAMRSAM